MQKSKVKEKLKKNEPLLVPKVNFMDPDIVEMVGLLGFDCVWVCNEHKAINPATLGNMVRAGRAAGVDCVIRTGANSYDDICRILECGANGLMIPHVKTPDEVRRVVSLAKYPPLGSRGLESVNADADFGIMSLEVYLKTANDETFIVVQIEDVEALDDVEKIAAVKGIDVIFVGPGDLSLSMGVPGDFKHQNVFDAIKKVAKACKANNIVCGTPAIDVEYCKFLLDEGVRYFTISSDWRVLINGFRDLKHVYAKLGFQFSKEGRTTQT